jgi:cytochrome P450
MKTLPVYSARPDDPAFFKDPYPCYEEMRRLGPAFYWPEYDRITFGGYAQVNDILRDRRFGREVSHVMSASQAAIPPVPEHLKPFYAFEASSMLEREPPEHTRLRGLVNRAFISRQIERLQPRIAALSNGLIDGFEDRGEADLLPVFAEKIPVIVIAELLGVPGGDADQLLEWSHSMVAMYQFKRGRAVEDRAVGATLAFSDYIAAHVAAKRGRHGDDLMTRLIEAEEKADRLSLQELVATCILLLNAGHEATVHGIGNAVKALLENGVDSNAVFADRDTAMAAVDEMLRFDAPLHLFSRYALQDVELDGVRIARGQQVQLLLGAANRDPARFAEPERLDFARGGSGHLAFGAGIHFCVGAPLARLEMAVALPVLFKRLPNLRLSGAAEYADRYHFHGLATLPVAW